MTVALAVATPDGIVLAADSRTTYGMPNRVTRVLSDRSHKIYNIRGRGVATYGFAFLSGRNLGAHMVDFEREVTDAQVASAETLANALSEFMVPRMEEHFKKVPTERPQPGVEVLGFLVAGYMDGDGRVFDVYLPSGAVVNRHNTIDGHGASWRGQTDVIRRLIKGADIDLLRIFAQQDSLSAEFAALGKTMSGMEYFIPFQSMNLQDGVDFAVFLIRTTIDTQRFTYGVLREPGSWPGVGGPIEIAVVTERGGFQWVQETKLVGERTRESGEQSAGPSTRA